MKRCICIHGHFYQPSRVNPCLETVEIQEDAYPYHDWNEKVTAECYMVNGGSHILNSGKRIKKILNNYSRISFDFGPILLSWLKANDEKTFRAIIEADRYGRERFGGHGNALAQIYNHVIMPLASKRDKYIQVNWAIKDFELIFGRKPEGFWLSETAVDYETLGILAEFGIKFTILSPNQALKTRKIVTGGNASWSDVSGGNINTMVPYLCSLPNRNSINVFFYDNNISNKVSFGNLLEDGYSFAKELINTPGADEISIAGPDLRNNVISKSGSDAPDSNTNGEISEIICIATDGETFGHHHKFGDMALAYALDLIETENLADITVFGEYLEKNTPSYEVKIKENSSWSCPHGISRWKEDCGCSGSTQPHASWNQKWRAPLRQGIDRLSNRIAQIYEQEMKKYIGKTVNDIWEPLENYIYVIDDRKKEKTSSFIKHYFPDVFRKGKDKSSVTNILKILEMYRQSMLMQSSDGWFFDDISRIESIQIMRHACRAMELAKELAGEDLEKDFLELLKKAKSNIQSFKDGKYIYESSVKPASCSFEKISSYLAFDILLENSPREIFTYSIDLLKTVRITLSEGTVAAGTAQITSKITYESFDAAFAAYSFNIKDSCNNENMAAFSKALNRKNIKVFRQMALSLKKIACNKKLGPMQQKKDIIKLLRLYFSGSAYKLIELLRDKKICLAERLMLGEPENYKTRFLNLFYNYLDISKDTAGKKLSEYFLDGIFPGTQSFIFEAVVYYRLKEDNFSETGLDEIKDIIKKTSSFNFIKKDNLDNLSTKKIDKISDIFNTDPSDLKVLKNLIGFLEAFKQAGIEVSLWRTQNTIFKIKESFPEATFVKRIKNLKAWLDSFNSLLEKMNIEPIESVD